MNETEFNEGEYKQSKGSKLLSTGTSPVWIVNCGFELQSQRIITTLYLLDYVKKN